MASERTHKEKESCAQGRGAEGAGSPRRPPSAPESPGAEPTPRRACGSTPLLDLTSELDVVAHVTPRARGSSSLSPGGAGFGPDPPPQEARRPQVQASLAPSPCSKE